MILSATYQSHTMNPATGTYSVVVNLVTNDERGTRNDRFENVPAPPAGTAQGPARQFMRDEISKRIAEMNAQRTVRDVIEGLAAGTNIPVTYTPPSPPAPTAFQVWLAKAQRLIRFKAIGMTDTSALAELSALQADVDATYVDGYIANV